MLVEVDYRFSSSLLRINYKSHISVGFSPDRFDVPEKNMHNWINKLLEYSIVIQINVTMATY